MTEPLILLSAYALLVGLTDAQQAKVASIVTPVARTAAEWSAISAQILANPISHWELDSLQVPSAPPASSGCCCDEQTDFLDVRVLYQTGYTPPENGTLIIQNLCFDCYFEGYLNQVPPLLSVPFARPVFSVGPLGWIELPVKGGQLYSIVMNGSAGPDHLDEVQAWFVHRRSRFGSGTLARHPLPVAI